MYRKHYIVQETLLCTGNIILYRKHYSVQETYSLRLYISIQLTCHCIVKNQSIYPAIQNKKRIYIYLIRYTEYFRITLSLSYTRQRILKIFCGKCFYIKRLRKLFIAKYPDQKISCFLELIINRGCAKHLNFVKKKILCREVL